MDIYKAIRELMQEKKRLDAVIASLEARSNAGPRQKGRRGRKSMSAEERDAVSRRMSAYWAARREQGTMPVSSPAQAQASSAPMDMLPPISRAAPSGAEISLS